MKNIVNENIKNLKPYIVKELDYDIKLDANENPYSIPECLPENLKKELESEIMNSLWNYYPDAAANDLRELIAKKNNLKKENILIGNGSDEILLNLMLCFVNEKKSIITHSPTFSMYKILSQMVNGKVIDIDLTEEFKLDYKKIIEEQNKGNVALTFICYPNNPTGQLFDEEAIIKIIENSQGIVVLDEAYYEFARKSFVNKLKDYKNLIILRTFSKAYGIAGLRVGYMMASEELIGEVNKVRLPYNLNKISQIIARKMLINKEIFDKIIDKLIEERERMYKELQGVEGLELYKSDSNSIFMKSLKSEEIFNELLENKILIRKFAGKLNNNLRISIGKKEENDKILKILKKIHK